MVINLTINSCYTSVYVRQLVLTVGNMALMRKYIDLKFILACLSFTNPNRICMPWRQKTYSSLCLLFIVNILKLCDPKWNLNEHTNIHLHILINWTLYHKSVRNKPLVYFRFSNVQMAVWSSGICVQDDTSLFHIWSDEGKKRSLVDS